MCFGDALFHFLKLSRGYRTRVKDDIKIALALGRADDEFM